MPALTPFPNAAPARAALQGLVGRVAGLLPSQGPISAFIHHNPLHAFEHLPFDEAVAGAGILFGCEPFLEEDRYREALRAGRITPRNLEAILQADLGTSANEHIIADLSRFELRRRVLVHGLRDESGDPLRWLLSETPALKRFRTELPRDARRALSSGARGRDAADSESSQVRALWQSCLTVVARLPDTPPRTAASVGRHRDLLLRSCGVDTDEWIHPVLIRFTSAFLDQGVAHRSMPGRNGGLHSCFLEIYGSRLAHLCGPWAARLPRILEEERSRGRDATTSLENSLAELGVLDDERESVLLEEALALRGWAGMVRQFEERPDRVPAIPVPARLIDFLAVRLLLTRAAVDHVARAHARLAAPLAELRATLSARLAVRPSRSRLDRAWRLFQAAQLAGLDAGAIAALSVRRVAALEAELDAFEPIERRRLLHLAYEQSLRNRLYDALVQLDPASPPVSPDFQAIFCIDEREESFRRHLEEVEPHAETFGTAGFFGIAMYFRGLSDARARPLCPANVQPKHYVTEMPLEESPGPAARARARRSFRAIVDTYLYFGSRTLTRGALIMATVGVLWAVPLILAVLFPWSRGRLRRDGVPSRQRTRLCLDRSGEAPPMGRHAGFTKEEMAAIVAKQLAPLGIIERLAPLVFVFGHGSTSLNNPQESAHDCGACGGAPGGPNARAFARMANDPAVRRLLVRLGVTIPDGTWFVGGLRNTASNDVVLFDEDVVPTSHRPRLRQARRALAIARKREAHERCRRFEGLPARVSEGAALQHTRSRAADLAQPRPEYGHATNAFCIIGRRERTRGLFLDRRAFLVSYDPTCDPAGDYLARLLAAVVPVVTGISLEYFFGYVDPTGYGCGTKLPHNVTGLLGVMDGAQSDLRTGLPWQMLEIHEPVRLTLVVEANVQMLHRVLGADASLRRLVANRWLYLACLDPHADELLELDGVEFRRHVTERSLARVPGSSVVHYRGARGHLDFARIDSAASGPSAQ